jgi:hypothetical protein
MLLGDVPTAGGEEASWQLCCGLGVGWLHVKSEFRPNIFLIGVFKAS